VIPARAGDAPRRCAVLDVGTNTVLMTAFERDERDGRALYVLEDLHFVTGLGRDRAPDGSLAKAGRDRALLALSHCADRLDALGIADAHVWAATTSAVREAPNGPRFVVAVGRECGIALSVISGEDEAELVALAQQRSFPDVGCMLVVDIGGGSTEIVLRRGGRTEWATSAHIGTVRLSDRCGEDRAAMRAMIDETLPAFPKGWDEVVAVAGTATTARQVADRAAIWDPAALHGRRLPRSEVAAVLQRLDGLDAAGRRAALPGVHPLRADVLPAGLMLLLAVYDRAGVDTLIVSDRGVRFGLLFRALPGVRVGVRT
jgi:exopolyphosphatase/guanosine-5'-triphosphate,3'-diphosphate pyrophosphatase